MAWRSSSIPNLADRPGLLGVKLPVDGLVLGLARLHRRSTRVRFWMHVPDNALAAWQRLGIT